MFDEPGAVEAEPVGELDLLERFAKDSLLVAVGPRAGHLVLVEQPESHSGHHCCERVTLIEQDCRTVE